MTLMEVYIEGFGIIEELEEGSNQSRRRERMRIEGYTKNGTKVNCCEMKS